MTVDLYSRMLNEAFKLHGEIQPGDIMKPEQKYWFRETSANRTVEGYGSVFESTCRWPQEGWSKLDIELKGMLLDLRDSLRRSPHVLYVGAAAGRYARAMPEIDFCCLDYSDDAVEIMTALGVPDVVKADGHATGLDGSSFDAVILPEQVVCESTDLAGLLTEAARVTRGSVFVINAVMSGDLDTVTEYTQEIRWNGETEIMTIWAYHWQHVRDIAATVGLSFVAVHEQAELMMLPGEFGWILTLRA
jgi:SAM-dependent methyltransferase